MVAEILEWTIGVLVIVYLIAKARQKTKDVTRRIAEVQEDLSRSPLPPMAMLADLYQDTYENSQETDGKRTH